MRHIVGGIGIILLVIFAAVVAGCTNDAAVADSYAETASTVSQETSVLPAGTRFLAVLDTRVSTDVNRTGDSFVARTIEPIVVDGRTVLPANSRIDGVLRDVQASGRIKDHARMTLVFQEIEDPAGRSYTLTALPLTIHSDAPNIVSASGTGTILVLATKGGDVKLDQGRTLYIELTGPTNFVVATRE